MRGWGEDRIGNGTDAYLDFSVECVVFARSDVHARVPFVTALPRQDVVIVDLSIVAPLLESKAPSS